VASSVARDIPELEASIDRIALPIADEVAKSGSTPAAQLAFARRATWGESFTASSITSAIKIATTSAATMTMTL
jgi:hypothetical protein